MVGETFPDTARMLAARQAAAQALASQTTAILNVEAAKNEVRRHADQGHYMTTPTSANPVIRRSNSTGATVPSITSSRNLTLTGPVQRAMSPSLHAQSYRRMI